MANTYRILASKEEIIDQPGSFHAIRRVLLRHCCMEYTNQLLGARQRIIRLKKLQSQKPTFDREFTIRRCLDSLKESEKMYQY